MNIVHDSFYESLIENLEKASKEIELKQTLSFQSLSNIIDEICFVIENKDSGKNLDDYDSDLRDLLYIKMEIDLLLTLLRGKRNLHKNFYMMILRSLRQMATSKNQIIVGR